MSSSTAAAYAVNVFMVDAGVRGTSMLFSAATLPDASAMAMENSPPKPAAEARNASVSARAAAGSMVLEASMSAITSAASIERPAAATVECSTWRNVRTPGATSHMSATA